MTGPMRIGIPDGTAPTIPRNSRCPGAALIVDRAEFHTLQRDGLVWSSGAKDLPAEGKGTARTFCTDDVEVCANPLGSYQAGLCRRCGQMETNQRRDLRERQASTRGGR